METSININFMIVLSAYIGGPPGKSLGCFQHLIKVLYNYSEILKYLKNATIDQSIDFIVCENNENTALQP